MAYPMRKKITPLATAFPLFATEYLVERLRHIGVVHNLLDDVTFSSHTVSFRH